MPAPVIPPAITILSTPPQTTDIANFDTRADTHVLETQALVPELNAANLNVYNNSVIAYNSSVAAVAAAGTAVSDASVALSSKNTAVTSASNAATSEANAALSEASALANKNAVIAAGALAGLPVLAGNAKKGLRVNLAETALEFADVTSIKRLARTANTMLAATDNSTLIDITSGTFTQTFDAAATLADGWFCYLRNSGAGIITLDPNGSDLIDGIAARTLTAKQTVLVICTGAGFVTVAIEGVGDHEVVVHTGNGNGSTNNRIRRFTTTLKNVGTAITYADSATLGASFTINEDGLYSFHYGESQDTGGSPYEFGVSLNSAQLTTPINSINIANRLAYAVTVVQTGGTSPLPNTVSRVVRLTAGDVVRAHGIGSSGTTNAVFFAIRKVGV